MFIKDFSSQKLKETWDPVLQSMNIDTSQLSESRRQWLYQYCHNHAKRAMGPLNEAGQTSASLGNVNGIGAVQAPSNPAQYGAGNSIAGPQGSTQNVFYRGNTGSGDVFPAALPVSIQVAAETPAFDLFPVIPMDKPAIMLPYLEYNYAGGQIRGQGKQNAPYVIAVNNLSQSTIDSLVKGRQYEVQESSGSNQTVMTLTFLGKHRITPDPIFRVQYTNNAGNLAISDVFTGTTTSYRLFDPTSGGSVVADSNALGGVRAELATALTNHIPGFSGAGSQDNDDFTLNFEGFEAGQYTNSNASGANAGPYASPMSRETGENTYYRELGMEMFSRLVEAETFQIALPLKTEQIQDYQSIWGIDAVGMSESACVNELTQSFSKALIGRAMALGWTNHINSYKTEGSDFNLHIGNNGVYSTYPGKDNTLATFPTSAGQPANALGFTGTTTLYENQETIQRRIPRTIGAVASFLHHRNRIGPGNCAVMSGRLTQSMVDVAGYMPSSFQNTFDQANSSVSPHGTVFGVTVYSDANMQWNDSRVCVMRKGSDEEPGIKFMPYLMAESISTIAEGTMAPKIAVKSRAAITEAGKYPETSYLTFDVTSDAGGVDFL
jgi:hypothetical protein